MARSGKYTSSSNLNSSSNQSTGTRSLIVLCIIAVLLLTFYLREGDSGVIHTVRSAVTTVASPMRVVGNAIASPFRAIGNAFTNATASEETLLELQEENEELTAQVAELEEAEATAERLEALLDLQSTYDLESTAARVIGTSGDAWSDTVTINKGSSSGFEVGMPVLGSGGVIGQITEVSATTSTVRLITDDESSISAMVQDSRAQGMLQGQADGTLLLSYVSTDADVEEGDIIITSGIGGVFPKGLPLGTVTSVEKSDNAVYYTIVVQAISSVETDEEVLVVTSIDEDQVASDEEVAEANSTPEGTVSEDEDEESEDSEDADSTDDSESTDDTESTDDSESTDESESADDSEATDDEG